MGFLSKIMGAGAPTPSVPKAARFKTEPDAIYVPVSGLLVPLDKVNDKTISQGIFGAGAAILPMGDVVFAPADGRVEVTMVTNHAIGIRTADGADVLVHVGIDTVKMDGKGFERFVEAGENVFAGQPLLAFDADRIAEAGFDPTVIVSVTNADERTVALVAESGTKIDGMPLLKVGEPLLRVG